MGGTFKKVFQEGTVLGYLDKQMNKEDKPVAAAPTTPAITQADVDAAITKSRDEDSRKREELRMGRKAKGEGTAVTAVRI